MCASCIHSLTLNTKLIWKCRSFWEARRLSPINANRFISSLRFSHAQIMNFQITFGMEVFFCLAFLLLLTTGRNAVTSHILHWTIHIRCEYVFIINVCKFHFNEIRYFDFYFYTIRRKQTYVKNFQKKHWSIY